MDISFTSDLHLGHDKDFIYDARGFSDIRSHDREVSSILRAFQCDKMYILGDVMMGGRKIERIGAFFNGLPYAVTLVVGNHDPHLEELTARGIDAVTSATVLVEGLEVLLSHFPANFVDHRGRDYSKHTPPDTGGVVLHGHTHSKTQVTTTKNGTTQVSVGWDAWGAPLHFFEVCAILDDAGVI